MFASLTRFRRRVAVLLVLSLVASVLVVAAPVAAADDPEMDYEATFSACIGAASEDAGFTDVPDGHTNAGDIDCIAYYGITRGTSSTTYAPLMSVSREHMALFLTRLADRVGIDLVSDPDDAGFTDIGDLSDESQTAINQLADLDITQGTSATTYSPSDSVRRDHMALFISRLMDQMSPMANGDTAMYGYTPDGVEDNANTPVGSPFTDLGNVTKSTYDAITALWELGVADGVSATSYAPSQSITRASMAGFMAGVLNHSNARPAGVSMQVDKTTGFGTVTATRAISVRDDSFAPIGDVSVKVFTASESGGFNEDTGKCITTANDPCDWSDNGEITNDDGNNFDEIDVATDGNAENSETWYAWMGSDDNSEFVEGSSGEAMVTLTAKADALGIRVATDTLTNTVKIGKDKKVVLTVQLIDNAGSDDATLSAAKAVAKEGVEISITAYTEGGTAVFPRPAAVKTDANGQAMFAIAGPAPDDDDSATVTRPDVLTFSAVLSGSSTVTRPITVNWTDAAAQVASAEADAPSYAIIDDDKVRITVTVKYFDQYGNPAGSGNRTTITVGIGSAGDDTFAESGSNGVRVRSNGTARFTANIEATAGSSNLISITGFQHDPDGDGTFVDVPVIGTVAPTAGPVMAVKHAHKNDDGKSGTRDTDGGANQVTVDADNDRFIINTGTADTDVRGVLYSYDADDTFLVNGATVDIDKFEEAIDTDGNTVTVVLYSIDGASIFSVS